MKNKVFEDIDSHQYYCKNEIETLGQYIEYQDDFFIRFVYKCEQCGFKKEIIKQNWIGEYIRKGTNV